MDKSESEGIIIANIAELLLGPASAITKYEPVYNKENPDCLVIKDGQILAIGETTRIFADFMRKDYEIIDCKHKKIVCPSFVDSHTHLVFGGDRSHELTMKLKGDSYQKIAESGGGINYTVRQTRSAKREELQRLALDRLDLMLKHGTTMIEAKSGYGLNQEKELELLEITNEVNQMHPIDIVPTFLGCHVVPEDFIGNSYEYVESMVELLPEIKRKNLAEYVDIWTDFNAFSVEESKVFLTAAKDFKFKIRMHADEMENVGAALLASEMKADSADHLLKAEAISASSMADAGVVANLLPGTPFVLMSKKYANYRMFKDAGATVALSTDFNPNCYLINMQTVIELGCYMMHMTPKEALEAATYGGAKSLKRENQVGTLDLEMRANLLIMDIPSIASLPYQFGRNHVDTVIKDGKILVKDGLIQKD